MALEEQVLRYLSSRSGEYCSGQQLAAALGVSRNTVWKAVEALRAQGIAVESLTNRGYRLTAPPITAEQIAARLRHGDFYTVELRRQVTSTNDLLKETAARGAPQGTVLVSLAQTEGRGRMGRSFHSPMGTGIYFSVLLRPTVQAARSLLITTAAAVAVAQAVERQGVPAAVKWVNDVFVNGKKVCGILTEASLSLESGRPDYAVLGVGLNLAPPADPPAELAQVAGGIFETPPDPDTAAALVADVLDGFADLYADLRPERFITFYRSHSLLTGKRVTAAVNGGDLTATVVGIDEDFALLLRADDGTLHRLTAGEVTRVCASPG